MQIWYRNPLPSRVGLRIRSCILQRKHTVHSVYMIFRFFAVRQERRRLGQPLRRHNLPILVCSQVGNGPREAGQREAQVALTYSIVLAVLAH